MGLGGSRAQSWGLCLSPPGHAQVQTCLKLLPMAFELVSELQVCKSQPFLCLPTLASGPQTLGQHILLWRAVAPLFIHLLLLWRLPQAVGRAQQGTSTLRICHEAHGAMLVPAPALCWHWGHQVLEEPNLHSWPCAGAGVTRSWRKPIPTPGCSPAPRTGAFWSSAPSPRMALPRPTLYLGPAAAGPPPLSPCLSRCLAGGHGSHQSRLCVSVLHPAPRATVRGCSACRALYIL